MPYCVADDGPQINFYSLCHEHWWLELGSLQRVQFNEPQPWHELQLTILVVLQP
jgi:hypothetical protein